VIVVVCFGADLAAREGIGSSEKSGVAREFFFALAAARWWCGNQGHAESLSHQARGKLCSLCRGGQEQILPQAWIFDLALGQVALPSATAIEVHMRSDWDVCCGTCHHVERMLPLG
jgi:hypothetical protein